MSSSEDKAGGLSAALPGRLQAALAPKRSRILIAEDDPISARILEAALSKLGYETVLARDVRRPGTNSTTNRRA